MPETPGFPPSPLAGVRDDDTPNATTQAGDHNDFIERLNHLVDELSAHEDNTSTAHGIGSLSQAGLQWKDSVRVATTVTGTLAVAFDNGSVVDGVTLVTGDRILVKDQSTGSQNGIYVVQASGAPVRATDAADNTEGPTGLVRAAAYVREGSTQSATFWFMTIPAPVTVNTTALVWAQFNGSANPAPTLDANYPGNDPQIAAVDDTTPATPSIHSGIHTVTAAEVNAIGADLRQFFGLLGATSMEDAASKTLALFGVGTLATLGAGTELHAASSSDHLSLIGSNFTIEQDRLAVGQRYDVHAEIEIHASSTLAITPHIKVGPTEIDGTFSVSMGTTYRLYVIDYMVWITDVEAAHVHVRGFATGNYSVSGQPDWNPATSSNTNVKSEGGMAVAIDDITANDLVLDVLMQLAGIGSSYGAKLLFASLTQVPSLIPA